MSIPFSQESRHTSKAETQADPRTDTEAGNAGGGDTSPERAAEASPVRRTSPPSPPSPARPEQKKRRGPDRIAVVLLLLLLVSVAMNVVQARQGARLENRLDEFELALNQAVERLDQQTARALDAEGTLSDVDTAMQTVRERIAGLQQALDELDSAARP